MTFVFRPPIPNFLKESQLLATSEFAYKDHQYTTDHAEVHSTNNQSLAGILQSGGIPRGYVGRQVSRTWDIRSTSLRRVAEFQEADVNYSDKPMPRVVPDTFLTKN